MNKINEATFLFKSEKKTDEGHLKQIGEGLRNIFLFGLISNFFLLCTNFIYISTCIHSGWSLA